MPCRMGAVLLLLCALITPIASHVQGTRANQDGLVAREPAVRMQSFYTLASAIARETDERSASRIRSLVKAARTDGALGLQLIRALELEHKLFAEACGDALPPGYGDEYGNGHAYVEGTGLSTYPKPRTVLRAPDNPSVPSFFRS